MWHLKLIILRQTNQWFFGAKEIDQKVYEMSKRRITCPGMRAVNSSSQLTCTAFARARSVKVLNAHPARLLLAVLATAAAGALPAALAGVGAQPSTQVPAFHADTNSEWHLHLGSPMSYGANLNVSIMGSPRRMGLAPSPVSTSWHMSQSVHPRMAHTSQVSAPQSASPP